METLIKKILAMLIFRPYFRLRASGMVRSYFNRPARKLDSLHPLPLTPVQEKVLGDLEENGIAVTHLDELFPGERRLDALLAHAEKLRPNGKVREGKPFLLALLPDDVPLTWGNPFVPIVFNETVFGIVNRYLGLYAKFFFSYLDVTLPVPPGENPFRSQNWHRDPEDKKMCKMFIYLKDVDEDAGPFIYIKGSHSVGAWGHVAPQKPPKGSYPSEEEIKKTIPNTQTLICTGRAGTVVFADTAGLHRGGYATKHERWMFSAGFSTLAALRGPLFRLSSEFRDETLPNLSPVLRYALQPEKRALAHMLNSILNFALKYGIY